MKQIHLSVPIELLKLRKAPDTAKHLTAYLMEENPSK